MKSKTAYSSDFDDRKLFHTARSAREAEFDHLMWKISQHVGFAQGLQDSLSMLARDLRGGVYPSAVDAFLLAADYLREHRHVLTGARLDELEAAYEPLAASIEPQVPVSQANEICKPER